MKKDIFIDNNIASKFSNPQDKEYIELTKWLLNYDLKDAKNKNNYAHLVVSNKLLKEYFDSAKNANSNTSIPMIIGILQSQGRLIIVKNQEIKDFKVTYFSKKIIRHLRCNSKDREHLPVVLLSDRKYALTYDDDFSYDLLNFPGFNVKVKKRPEDLPYSI